MRGFAELLSGKLVVCDAPRVLWGKGRYYKAETMGALWILNF